MSDTQKLRLEIVLELDEGFYPSGDLVAQDWLVNRILKHAPAGELALFSDEVGDTLGTVSVRGVWLVDRQEEEELRILHQAARDQGFADQELLRQMVSGENNFGGNE